MADEARAELKKEKEIKHAIRQFWDVMAAESSRASAVATGVQEVNRDAYGQLHMRVSKALSEEEWMDLEESKNIANTDWVEDISAFSGMNTAAVWFEEMKIKFSAVVSTFPGGWADLFARYDDDDSGELDFDEFVEAVRKDCDMGPEVVSDIDLKTIFAKVDADDSGTITADEFDRLIMNIEPGAAGEQQTVTTMSFEIFFESMFELAEVWATQLAKNPIVNFLGQLFSRVTVNPTSWQPGTSEPVRLRGLVTKKLVTMAHNKEMYRLDTEQEDNMAELMKPIPEPEPVYVPPEPEPEPELEPEVEPDVEPEPEPESEPEPEPEPEQVNAVLEIDYEALRLAEEARLAREAERERLRLEQLRLEEEARRKAEWLAKQKPPKMTVAAPRVKREASTTRKGPYVGPPMGGRIQARAVRSGGDMEIIFEGLKELLNKVMSQGSVFLDNRQHNDVRERWWGDGSAKELAGGDLPEVKNTLGEGVKFLLHVMRVKRGDMQLTDEERAAIASLLKWSDNEFAENEDTDTQEKFAAMHAQRDVVSVLSSRGNTPGPPVPASTLWGNRVPKFETFQNSKYFGAQMQSPSRQPREPLPMLVSPRVAADMAQKPRAPRSPRRARSPRDPTAVVRLNYYEKLASGHLRSLSEGPEMQRKSRAEDRAMLKSCFQQNRCVKPRSGCLRVLRYESGANNVDVTPQCVCGLAQRTHRAYGKRDLGCAQHLGSDDAICQHA